MEWVRIRTECEFIKRFGERWSWDVEYTFTDSMRPLLGKRFKYIGPNKYQFGDISAWISDDMIVRDERFEKHKAKLMEAECP